MKLSAPIHQLKRRAKLLARDKEIPLHQALDCIAREEGFAQWSLLSSRFAMNPPSTALLSRLADGDLLLLGARPGHGKTLLGLQLLMDALCEGRKAVLFTLEYTERQTRERIRKHDLDAHGIGDRLEIVASDDICADHIIRHLSGSERGSVVIIDYLQILDQQRSKAALPDQMLAIHDFARKTGLVFGFISQIDRSFELQGKPMPEIRDIRLPNEIDLGLFSKTCFLHNGEMSFQSAA